MASDDRKLEPEESNRLRVGDVLVSSTCNEETVDYGGHRTRQKTSGIDLDVCDGKSPFERESLGRVAVIISGFGGHRDAHQQVIEQQQATLFGLGDHPTLVEFLDRPQKDQ